MRTEAARGGTLRPADVQPAVARLDSWLVIVILCLIEALPQRVVRLLAVVALILLAGLHGPVVQAGVYTDDLSNCLVKSSNDADRLVLVRWIFSGLSLHPAVQPLVSITPEQRDAFNEKVAAVLSRLLADDCRKEAVSALKYEGSAALDASFQVLGQVASRDLMTEPHVANAATSIGRYLVPAERANRGGFAPLPAFIPRGDPSQARSRRLPLPLIPSPHRGPRIG